MSRAPVVLRQPGGNEVASNPTELLSRRRFLECSASGAVTLGLLGSVAEANEFRADVAYNRMNKVASHYQNRPNGSEYCGRCRHFQAPHACEIVTGRISPRGWCRYFSAGANSGASGMTY
jgi:hypothetical protein